MNVRLREKAPLYFVMLAVATLWCVGSQAEERILPEPRLPSPHVVARFIEGVESQLSLYKGNTTERFIAGPYLENNPKVTLRSNGSLLALTFKIYFSPKLIESLTRLELFTMLGKIQISPVDSLKFCSSAIKDKREKSICYPATKKNLTRSSLPEDCRLQGEKGRYVYQCWIARDGLEGKIPRSIVVPTATFPYPFTHEELDRLAKIDGAISQDYAVSYQSVVVAKRQPMEFRVDTRPLSHY